MEIAANGFASGSVRNRPLSKRAYALPADAVLPACLPAKQRASANVNSSLQFQLKTKHTASGGSVTILAQREQSLPSPSTSLENFVKC